MSSEPASTLHELYQKNWGVRKGIWIQSIRNSLPSIITFNVMTEDKAEDFVTFHKHSSLPPIAFVPEISPIDFELGYGGCKAMNDSAMLILRATLSESADAFPILKGRIIEEHATMFPGMSKTFVCQPTETSILLVAIFPQARAAWHFWTLSAGAP